MLPGGKISNLTAKRLRAEIRARKRREARGSPPPRADAAAKPPSVWPPEKYDDDCRVPKLREEYFEHDQGEGTRSVLVALTEGTRRVLQVKRGFRFRFSFFSFFVFPRNPLTRSDADPRSHRPLGIARRRGGPPRPRETETAREQDPGGSALGSLSVARRGWRRREGLSRVVGGGGEREVAFALGGMAKTRGREVSGQVRAPPDVRGIRQGTGRGGPRRAQHMGRRRRRNLRARARAFVAASVGGRRGDRRLARRRVRGARPKPHGRRRVAAVQGEAETERGGGVRGHA